VDSLGASLIVLICLFDLCTPYASTLWPKNSTVVAKTHLLRFNFRPLDINRWNTTSRDDNRWSKLLANTNMSSKKLSTFGMSCRLLLFTSIRCHIAGMFAAPYTARVGRMRPCVGVLSVKAWTLLSVSTGKCVYVSVMSRWQKSFAFFIRLKRCSAFGMGYSSITMREFNVGL